MATDIRPVIDGILQWPIIRTTVAVAGCSPDQAKPNSFRCASHESGMFVALRSRRPVRVAG